MQLSYQNPVYPEYFADPFVLLVDGMYYAYGTSNSTLADGRAFPVLRSHNLVEWVPLGGTLELPEGAASSMCWAPEVVECGGSFFLFYSSALGDEANHRLRVAVANNPAGPFRDTGGLLLPDEGFSIDAHPFRDPVDGQWYLFFAKDFFDERVGTGIAVAPLADDMRSVTGPATTVVRASADWQIYERNRTHYGRQWDAWHTVEGPFVLFHEGRYYCLYSGGSWLTPQYGLSYAVADHVMGPYQDQWSAEGPAVLRGVPNAVIGPGHNSVIIGPDGRTPFVVYHAWDVAQTARRMCIDPLVWTPDGPRCDGPSFERRVLNL